MLAVVGTIPDQNFPLIAGKITLDGNRICIEGKKVDVNRGTPALLAAAYKAGEALGRMELFGYLVGDIGLGDGSRRLYEYLTENLEHLSFSAITFHYLQPDVDWHNRVLFALKKMAKRPVLIADAGFMYAAKMSGQSQEYDLFTPDIGELAFLADETAPHPFYTRGFILHEENRVPDLIARAYEHNNASQSLLIKGEKDYLANRHGIQAAVNGYVENALEAIGGTGDTLTGIVAALIESGMEISDAAIIAAKANRLAGHYARPTPATQVIEIIQQIPGALEEILEEKAAAIK
ncbi:MAG: sugar kinase [Deltaproteobacteria bacterium]|nr:sugar kinase [Deltaproteobacteria bacterium]MBW2662093.1 sugar kinase [Deltaproteobacteria bacterium]